jgi:hypothetical protein
VKTRMRPVRRCCEECGRPLPSRGPVADWAKLNAFWEEHDARYAGIGLGPLGWTRHRVGNSKTPTRDERIKTILGLADSNSEAG